MDLAHCELESILVVVLIPIGTVVIIVCDSVCGIDCNLDLLWLQRTASARLSAALTTAVQPHRQWAALA